MVLVPCSELAAWTADRSVTSPKASCPVVRFAATVSARLLTAKTAGAVRTSSATSRGRKRPLRKSRPGSAEPWRNLPAVVQMQNMEAIAFRAGVPDCFQEEARKPGETGRPPTRLNPGAEL